MMDQYANLLVVVLERFQIVLYLTGYESMISNGYWGEF